MEYKTADQTSERKLIEPVTPKAMSLEFRAVCNSALETMQGGEGSEIANYRQRNLIAYNAEPTGEFAGPEIEDRSTIVATNARDTVNWMMPDLMKTFLGTDNAVEFTATRQDKEADCKLMTEYINYLFRTKNNGFEITEQWFKDALREKVGFIKSWWDWKNLDNRENYQSLTAEQIEALTTDENVELIGEPEPVGHFMLPGPDGQPVPTPLFSVSIKRTKRKGALCIVPCPPEQMRIARTAKYSEEPDCIAHVFPRTRFELEDEGYDMSQCDGGIGSAQINPEAWLRSSVKVDETNSDIHESMQLHVYAELYIRFDYDDDKVTEWRKVVKIGGTYYENSKTDGHPFNWTCPIPMPHTFWGECPVDYAIGPQKLNTMMIRAVVDNTVLSVNPRTEVVDGMVNLEDLLNPAPGGVVRVTQMGQTREIAIPDMTGSAYKVIELATEWNENTTGFTRYSQGTDSNALNKTATGVSIITQKADMRMELIKRNFAESFKKVFRKWQKLVTENQDEPEMIKVSGQWVNVDPSQWTDEYEMSVNVGLGTGDRQGQLQKAQMLIQNAMQLLPTGVTTLQNVQAGEKVFMQALDIQQPELHYQTGQLQPQQQAPNPDAIKAQQAQAAQQQEQQHAMLMSAAQHEADQQKFQRDQAVAQQQADREERLRSMELQAEYQYKQWEFSARNDLEWKKAQLASQTSIEVASIGVQGMALKGDQALQQATTVARTKAVAELNGQILDHRHDALMAAAGHEASMQLAEAAPKTNE